LNDLAVGKQAIWDSALSFLVVAQVYPDSFANRLHLLTLLNSLATKLFPDDLDADFSMAPGYENSWVMTISIVPDKFIFICVCAYTLPNAESLRCRRRSKVEAIKSN
jgi:hypothetical protein